MRIPPSVCIAIATLGLGMPVWSQGPARPGYVPTPPPKVEGLVGELLIEASVAGLEDAPASPEAHAFLGQLRDKATLRTQLYLAEDLSRQEVLSTDFALPAGTVILHEAGSKFYVLADPKAQTYVVMDAEGILKAFEGGVGIENSEYSAKASHTGEKKDIAGVSCRRSILAVTYVSSIPLEHDKVMVQQTNEMEIWHTPDFVSRAVFDHFFFKFQRDKTGTVQKVAARELGFPMDLSMTITQGRGPKARAVGALRMSVASIRREKRLDSELFRIPPSGYKKLERNPYFAPRP